MSIYNIDPKGYLVLAGETPDYQIIYAHIWQQASARDEDDSLGDEDDSLGDEEPFVETFYEVTDHPFEATRFNTVTLALREALAEMRKRSPNYKWTIRQLTASSSYFISQENEDYLWTELIRKRAIAKLDPEERKALGLSLAEQIDDEVPWTE